jgi:hypothetical protein
MSRHHQPWHDGVVNPELTASKFYRDQDEIGL